ncbi:type II CAAX endopeptidase family protein [Paraclostridium tenue]|uniref:CAAX prenyl protease 2/Lysostaphin resistance protein A-like domain-containing protein n=1 Tax=Paraclostridium tenue TaxID=1737 RepID=A0ABP3XMZ6_9FIRM
MKKLLKSLCICLGLPLLNYLNIGLVDIAATSFIKDFNNLEHAYTTVLIGDLATLILTYFIFKAYGKKLLSKEILKPINLKSIIYIIIFGIGISIILSNLIGILMMFSPSYIDVQNQIQNESNSLLNLSIIIILAPVCEEILFRNVVFGYLRKNYNIVIAVLVQALIFGIIHGNFVQGIYTFTLGIGLALVYMYYDSLWACIILHIVFNLMGDLIIQMVIDINPDFNYGIVILGIACLGFSIFKVAKKYEHILYE